MSNSWIKIGISVLVLALVGAACSSGDSSKSGTSSKTPTSSSNNEYKSQGSSPATNGEGSSTTPPCTDAALRPAVIAALSSGEQLFQLNAFNCASNWAVTNPTVGIPSNELDITLLMRWDGSAWQSVDRGVYCDNGSVPASIYEDACNSN